MPSELLRKTAIAASLLFAAFGANAKGLADFFRSDPSTAAVAQAPSLAGKKDAGIHASPIDSKSEDVPQWLRDSERLNKMLGDSADFRVENAKVIRKFDSPVPGLDGFVVEATSYTKDFPDGKTSCSSFTPTNQDATWWSG